MRTKKPLWILWCLTTLVTVIMGEAVLRAAKVAKPILDQCPLREVPWLTEFAFLLAVLPRLLLLELLVAGICAWIVCETDHETGVIAILGQLVFFIGICGLVIWGLLLPFSPITIRTHGSR